MERTTTATAISTVPTRNAAPCQAYARENSSRKARANFAATASTTTATARYLGSLPVNPDRHRGKFHIVFIDGVAKAGETHFDSTEDIESSELSDSEPQQKIADGTFCHPLQIAGYYKWKLTTR